MDLGAVVAGVDGDPGAAGVAAAGGCRIADLDLGAAVGVVIAAIGVNVDARKVDIDTILVGRAGVPAALFGGGISPRSLVSRGARAAVASPLSTEISWRVTWPPSSVA